MKQKADSSDMLTNAIVLFPTFITQLCGAISVYNIDYINSNGIIHYITNPRGENEYTHTSLLY